jgi:ankyrin repeat protein
MKLDEFVLACKHPEINKQVIIDSLASIKTDINNVCNNYSALGMTLKNMTDSSFIVLDKLLCAGANTNGEAFIDEYHGVDLTPLEQALLCEHSESPISQQIQDTTLNLLLDKKSNIHRLSEHTIYACTKYKNKRLLTFLLDNKVSPNTTVHDEPLLSSIIDANTTVEGDEQAGKIKLLIERKADLHAVDRNGIPLIKKVVRLDIFEVLLSHHPELSDQLTIWDKPSFHIPQVMTKIIATDPDVIHSYNEHGLTPLMQAVSQGNSTATHCLIAAKSNPDSLNHNLESAIIIADRYRWGNNFLNYLLQYKLTTTDEIYSLFLTALSDINTPAIKAILQRHPELNVNHIFPDSERTPLSTLALAAVNSGKNCCDAMQLLFNKGANPNIADTDDAKSTPLLYCCGFQCRIDIRSLRFLLKNKADPNITNTKGEAALHRLMQSCCSSLPIITQSIQALLLAGADPYQKSGLGLMPRDIIFYNRDFSEDFNTAISDVFNAFLPNMNDLLARAFTLVFQERYIRLFIIAYKLNLSIEYIGLPHHTISLQRLIESIKMRQDISPFVRGKLAAIQLLSAQAELRHLSEHELKMAGECIDKINQANLGLEDAIKSCSTQFREHNLPDPRLLFSSKSVLEKIHENHLCENRHRNSRSQELYDRRFGLIAYEPEPLGPLSGRLL